MDPGIAIRQKPPHIVVILRLAQISYCKNDETQDLAIRNSSVVVFQYYLFILSCLSNIYIV